MKQYTQGIDHIGLIINGYILIFFPSLSFDGSKASNIAKAGRSYGLEVKAHRYGVDEVKENVTYPAIIHCHLSIILFAGFRKKNRPFIFPAYTPFSW